MGKLPGTALKLLLALLILLVLVIIAAILLAPGIHPSSILMMLNVMTGSGTDTPGDELLARLQTRPGYNISIFARDLPHPRFLHRAADGSLLVSNPRSGEIIQLRDENGDGFADSRRSLLGGLQRPHGIDMHNGYLYIAESNQVGRIPYDGTTGDTDRSYQPIITGLTDNGNHWSKSIRFSPAGELFLALGSTCNVCDETDERRATIMRFDADGGNGEIYATGLRNSVGLDFAPWDGALYATDNGRDLLGDDFPPCELNRITQGGYYGWPHFNGANLPDPDFGDKAGELQARPIAPAFEFRAHNAPLGIHFPPGNRQTALVALHGSWNRSVPDGYRVLELSWSADGDISAEDFMWGFELDGDIIGRPVDIVSDGRGGFFVSDDYARLVYRVSPTISAGGTTAQPREEDSPAGQLLAIKPELVAFGAGVYASHPCGDCHDADAQTPIRLDRLGGRYSLESLAEYFLTPTPPMPLFDLDEKQRAALAHYLLSRQ